MINANNWNKIKNVKYSQNNILHLFFKFKIELN